MPFVRLPDTLMVCILRMQKPVHLHVFRFYCSFYVIWKRFVLFYFSNGESANFALQECMHMTVCWLTITILHALRAARGICCPRAQWRTDRWRSQRFVHHCARDQKIPRTALKAWSIIIVNQHTVMCMHSCKAKLVRERERERERVDKLKHQHNTCTSTWLKHLLQNYWTTGARFTESHEAAVRTGIYGQVHFLICPL